MCVGASHVLWVCRHGLEPPPLWTRISLFWQWGKHDRGWVKCLRPSSVRRLRCRRWAASGWEVARKREHCALKGGVRLPCFPADGSQEGLHTVYSAWKPALSWSYLEESSEPQSP